jgi:hypothetical protein
MNIYKGLREITENVNYSYTINEVTNIKKWTISGITLKAEEKNGNGRIYPKNILSGAINEHLKRMSSGGCVGELMHPDNGDMNINLERISHKFTDIKEQGNNYFTKAIILDTPQGKIVQNLLENEIQLGLSSRAVGNLDHKKDAIYVTKLHIMSFGDIVANPSCPGAFVQGLFENKEWIYENGVVIGKDLEPKLDEYKNVIDAATAGQRNNAMIKVFKDYLKELIG